MNLYFIGSALNLSSLYMIAGCGAAISIKSGEFNLGGEGQIYAGGFICAIILTSLPVPSFVAILLALFAAFFTSALLTFISYFLLLI